MRLAGSNLGIGITNPDTILHIKAANPYATIQASSDGGECGVHFEDDDGNVDGKITYRTDYTGNTDNYMRFYTAQTNALEINSDQEVLPQSHLRIKDSKALYLGNSNDFTLWHDATDSRIRYNHSAGSLKFQLNDNTTIGLPTGGGAGDDAGPMVGTRAHHTNRIPNVVVDADADDDEDADADDDDYGDDDDEC